jgi:hypothetical protein
MYRPSRDNAGQSHSNSLSFGTMPSVGLLARGYLALLLLIKFKERICSSFYHVGTLSKHNAYADLWTILCDG